MYNLIYKQTNLFYLFSLSLSLLKFSIHMITSVIFLFKTLYISTNIANINNQPYKKINEKKTHKNCCAIHLQDDDK